MEVAPEALFRCCQRHLEDRRYYERHWSLGLIFFYPVEGSLRLLGKSWQKGLLSWGKGKEDITNSLWRLKVAQAAAQCNRKTRALMTGTDESIWSLNIQLRGNPRRDGHTRRFAKLSWRGDEEINSPYSIGKPKGRSLGFLYIPNNS